MESHWLWDNNKAKETITEYDIPSFSSNKALNIRGNTSILSFLQSFGLEDSVIENISEESLHAMNEHLQEFHYFKKEIESHRTMAHQNNIEKSNLEMKNSQLAIRLESEQKESANLHQTLTTTIESYRVERSKTLREINELKKQCAKLKGLDSNHLATCRRIENDYSRCRDRLEKAQSSSSSSSSSSNLGNSSKKTLLKKNSISKNLMIKGTLPPSSQNKVLSCNHQSLNDSVLHVHLEKMNILIKTNLELKETIQNIKETYISQLNMFKQNILSPSTSIIEGATEKEDENEEIKIKNDIKYENNEDDKDENENENTKSNEIKDEIIKEFKECQKLLKDFQKTKLNLENEISKSKEEQNNNKIMEEPKEEEEEELKMKLQMAEERLIEQDFLIQQAIFLNVQGQSYSSAQSPSQCSLFKEENEWDLNEELNYILKREESVYNKENKLIEETEKLDMARIKLTENQFASYPIGPLVTPNRSKKQPLNAMKNISSNNTNQQSSSFQSPTFQSPTPTLGHSKSHSKINCSINHQTSHQSDHYSPIHLQVPATPGTTKLLKNLGIQLFLPNQEQNEN